VKIAKNLFKKAHKDAKDPWLALLDYRNTPTEGVQTSPCQHLMSRRTRTLLPLATSLLYPEVSEGIKERLQRKRQKAKSNFDRNGKLLPDLDVGQEVREIKPGSWGSALKSYLIDLTWYKRIEKKYAGTEKRSGHV
jgi:hypothetical protein